MSTKKTAALQAVCLAICSAATLASAAFAPASAKGVTLIQQRDGSTHTYSGVDMRVAGQTVTLRSADGKGTMMISTSACSFKNDLMRCLPYDVMLVQAGKTHHIQLSHGTVFMNLTGAAHRLPLSSESLAPRSVLVLLNTAHGTYVTAKGRLDGVKP
jgi:hypothetical protein